MKFIKIANKISTPPDRKSYQWKDGHSLISFVLLRTLWLLRLISLLQILKFIYRLLSKENKTATKDRGSKARKHSAFASRNLLYCLASGTFLISFLPNTFNLLSR